MTKCNERENKAALIEAINNYATSLDGLFVADNLRVISMREQTKRMHARVTGEDLCNTNIASLADFIACEMEGINGGGWQYDTDEVIEMVEGVKWGG